MLATYFNVDFKSYHTWRRQFKPFGHHERFDVGSVNRKRKLVRLAKGTEVPSPMGDPNYMSHHKNYHASRPANSHLSMSEAVSGVHVLRTHHHRLLSHPSNAENLQRSMQVYTA